MTLLNVVSSHRKRPLSLSLSVDGDILGNPMCSKYIPQETDLKQYLVRIIYHIKIL